MGTKEIEYSIMEELRMGPDIYIYGAGFVGRKVLKLCRENNLKNIVAAMVDEPYYQENSFLEGIPIYTPEMVLAKRKDEIVILMGMKDMSKGHKLKEGFPQIKKVYCLPNLACEEEFYLSREEYVRHQLQISEVQTLLADEVSKEVFSAWIEGCISYDVSKIFNYCKEHISYFNNGIFGVEGDSSYVDVGAYIGDTIEDYIEYNNAVKHIYAFEGDAEFCEQMHKKFCVADGAIADRIKIYSCILWSKNTEVSFAKSSQDAYVGACVHENNSEKNDVAKTLDSVLLNNIEGVDLLKINVIGSAEVLEGAASIVRKFHPKIAIKVGWTGFDNTYKIITLLKKYNYQIYMRFNGARLEELTIYAK